MYQYIELYALYRKNIYKYTYTRLYLKTQINIHLIHTTVSVFIYFYISIYFLGQSYYGIYWYNFMYITHHFILLRLNHFGLGVDRTGCWFQNFVSQVRFCVLAEGAKNVSWPQLSPFRGQGSLTMAFTGKFVYISLTISSCYGSSLSPWGC